MPLATARAMVEGCEVVIVAQALRREMWRWPRTEKFERRVLARGVRGRESGVILGRSYRSDGETRWKESRRPSLVRRGDGFPESSRKSSWSIVVGDVCCERVACGGGNAICSASRASDRVPASSCLG